MDDAVADLKVTKIKQWMEKMKDRGQWRLVVEEAKAHPGLYRCEDEGMVFVFSFNVSTCSSGGKHAGNYIDKCNHTVKALCESLILDHVLPLACVVCIVQSKSNYVACSLCCVQISVV